MAKVLVIDDSDSILNFTQDALTEDGHTVLIAHSGLEANRYIFSRDKQPDLILLDIVMPMLHGDRIIQAFKQSEISRNIPVVFFSSKDEQEIIALVEKHDALGYIKKPISREDLSKKVGHFLKKIDLKKGLQKSN